MSAIRLLLERRRRRRACFKVNVKCFMTVDNQ